MSFKINLLFTVKLTSIISELIKQSCCSHESSNLVIPINKAIQMSSNIKIEAYI